MTPEVVRDTAFSLHVSGFNCAESVIRAYCVAKGIEPSMYTTVMTGFGGGGGNSGCICGALAGAIAAIGIAHGRAKLTDDKRKAYRLSRRMHELFIAENKSTCCRTLRSYRPQGAQQHDFCHHLTGRTAQIVYELLAENDKTDNR